VEEEEEEGPWEHEGTEPYFPVDFDEVVGGVPPKRRKSGYVTCQSAPYLRRIRHVSDSIQHA